MERHDLGLNPSSINANIPNADPSLVSENIVAQGSGTASVTYKWRNVPGEIVPNRTAVDHTMQVSGDLVTDLTSPHYCSALASSALNGYSTRNYHYKNYRPEDERIEYPLILPTNTQTSQFIFRTALKKGQLITASFTGSLRNEVAVSLTPVGSTSDPVTHAPINRFSGFGSATASVSASTSDFSTTSYNDN